ncbi:MAG: DUF1659 domain-containing protein [Syntrophomonadaceae bacterium]
MAVQSTPIGGDVAIIYDNSGKAVTRRFNDVKVDATDEAVYDVAAGANGIAGLQTLLVASVQRRAVSELENV